MKNFNMRANVLFPAENLGDAFEKLGEYFTNSAKRLREDGDKEDDGFFAVGSMLEIKPLPVGSPLFLPTEKVTTITKLKKPNGHTHQQDS